MERGGRDTMRPAVYVHTDQSCSRIKYSETVKDTSSKVLCSRRRPTCASMLTRGECSTNNKTASRTALILYGSETGNAQDVAEEVGRMAERLRFDTLVVDMDSAQLRDLIEASVVIFALSTTGQGEMPQNARAFWRRLLSGALKHRVLRKLTFSSFGLGDSSYAGYNVAHRMLCARLVQLGARAFADFGEGNEQHPEGYSAGYREWIITLRQQLLDRFPQIDGLAPIADDVFIEPKWQLCVAAEASSNENLNGYVVTARTKDKDIPGPDLLPVVSSCSARIASNDRVTIPAHFQDVRLLDLHIDRAWVYTPGAIAVVYPKNFPRDVQEFINLMGWNEVADVPLCLTLSSDISVRKPSSPLRHLDLTEVKLTLRWLLENVLDILSIPRRSFFAELVHIADNKTEDGAYQKERLLELADPQLIDELWDYTTRPKRTILEVMMDFTTIKIPWKYALYFLPHMKGRQFSIASGGHLRQTSEGQTRIQLLVAIVNPPSPIIKWRPRYGVCTRYIATLKAGQHINIGLEEGYLDVRASEIDVPVVLIGPGTGLAPMRSMVYQRLLWSQEKNPDPTTKHLEQDILIFGCRSSTADYFFQAEWEDLHQTQGLTILTAFSRDKTQPREYVQDRIRKQGKEIFSKLVTQHGKVYVCGSSGNMPKGVRQALVDVLVEHGGPEFSTTERAESFLQTMEKDGRYKQETW